MGEGGYQIYFFNPAAMVKKLIDPNTFVYCKYCNNSSRYGWIMNIVYSLGNKAVDTQ